MAAKNGVPQFSWKSSSLIASADEASQRSLFTGDENLEEISQVNSKKGIMLCDSGSLIPNSTNVFESQQGIQFDKKLVHPATSFYSRIKDVVQSMHFTGAVVSGDQNGVENGQENLPTQLGEEIENMETAANITNSSEILDFEQFSGVYPGTR